MLDQIHSDLPPLSVPPRKFQQKEQKIAMPPPKGGGTIHYMEIPNIRGLHEFSYILTNVSTILQSPL
nr:hypothetical protein SHINE37_80115 [Rhizobiaceae bacterium]